MGEGHTLHPPPLLEQTDTATAIGSSFIRVSAGNTLQTGFTD